MCAIFAAEDAVLVLEKSNVELADVDELGRTQVVGRNICTHLEFHSFGIGIALRHIIHHHCVDPVGRIDLTDQRLADIRRVGGNATHARKIIADGNH